MYFVYLGQNTFVRYNCWLFGTESNIKDILLGESFLIFHLYIPLSDVHQSFFYISLVRILRIFGIITTIFLPGFYISIITYELDQIPYSLVATLAVSRLDLPLSAPAEAFIILVLV
jgi:hypothetical protein